jgi:hypothetical protein|tara:strand:- start:1310 stop:1474 length:165 start_codon:yes stop_codon:yes gene_type:complete
MNDTKYVIFTESDVAYIGTLDSIQELCSMNGIDPFNCHLHEIGKEVSLKLAVVE